MTGLEAEIQAIEHGLLKVTRNNDRPGKKMDLVQRMKHYKVPGVSIAFIDQEALVWQKGFGVMEAGGEMPMTIVVIKDGMTRFGHPGWNEGFHSIILGCPETGQGLVWMSNGENGRKLGWEISHGLADIVGWSWW